MFLDFFNLNINHFLKHHFLHTSLVLCGPISFVSKKSRRNIILLPQKTTLFCKWSYPNYFIVRLWQMNRNYFLTYNLPLLKSSCVKCQPIAPRLPWIIVTSEAMEQKSPFYLCTTKMQSFLKATIVTFEEHLLHLCYN